MANEHPNFPAAKETLLRELQAYTTNKPRTNLLKYVWALVHETSPKYAEAVNSKPIANADGFVLVRGEVRSSWADRFPKDCISTLINIGDEAKAFSFPLSKTAKLDGLVALDLLEALFDGAPDAEKPTILRTETKEGK